MTEDTELLRLYAENRSETAFAELVQRHLNLVYSTALRQLNGDAHAAEDVAQTVFNALARKASSLTTHRTLAGWLYLGAHHAATQTVRGERRRHAREWEAHTMQELSVSSESAADWDRVRPVLDDAMAILGEDDREAVLLRYFEQRPFAEIGAALKLSEDASRMRVDRALEKLRILLGRRGITSTGAALVAALGNQAMVAAPSGLAVSITGSAIAGAAGSGMATFMILMHTTKIQGALLAAVLLTGSVGLLLQQQSHAKLTDELAGLRVASVQRVRLQRENIQLAAPATELPDPLDDELARARGTADELKRRLAEQPKTPLAPGLVPTTAWKNVGQATPGEAFETLQWARSAIDIGALGKLMAFAPGDRVKVEDVFSRLPAEVRLTANLTSPEELAGFMYAMIEPSAGARVTRATKQGDDDVEVRVEIQRMDGRVDPSNLQFHHTADGWRLVVPTRELHHGLNEMGHEFIPGYTALEGGK